MAVLTHINISPGGIPKRSILVAHVTRAGIESDRQKNLKYHSGLDRAICLYSHELYAELGADGIRLLPGDVGENFTTRDLDLMSLAPGDRLAVGECEIEITKIRVPCKQLNALHPDLMQKITGRSGWMARVLKGGTLHPGAPIERFPA